MSPESTVSIVKFDFYPSHERGHANYGWLDTYHSFSFADFYDPARMGFGALRVLNEDRIEPGRGFGMHSHDNMEIVTIVLDGQIEHRDSMKNHGVIGAGEVQRMSAGTGITHSEFNHSKIDPVHLLQIWILPKEKNILPSYEQKKFPEQLFLNRFYPVVSSNKEGENISIHQDAIFSLGYFMKEMAFAHTLVDSNHGIYFFVIEGLLRFHGKELGSGDAFGITKISEVSIDVSAGAKVLAIEVPLT